MTTRRRHKAAVLACASFVLVAGAAMAAELIDGDYTKGDKTNGPPPKLVDPNPGVEWTADEGGTAAEGDHADDADTATTGSYADEGGEAPHADHADTSTTADHAPTADTADYADYAEDVAECAGGPFLGGNCGDMRYDGRLGLGGPPSATLDVHGDAKLGPLSVTSTGQVSIARSPTLGLELTVGGNLRATQFLQSHSTRIDPRICTRDPSADDFFVDANGWMYAARDLSVTDGLFCPVRVPPGATVIDVSCDKSGNVIAQWWARQWNESTRALRSTPFGVVGGEVHYIKVSQFVSADSGFGGCTIRWTTPPGHAY